MKSQSYVSLVWKGFLVLTVASIFSLAAYGQSNDKPTEAEKKAARSLASDFEIKLDDAGSIEPVAKEMFPNDFMGRWIDQERRRLKGSGSPSRENVPYVPGLDYDSKLLDTATEEDWRRLYVSTFDLFQYPVNRMINHAIEVIRSGKKQEEMEDDLVDIKPTDLYPSDVLTLLDKQPLLKNFVLKGQASSKPIASVDDIRSVNATLREALILLRKHDEKDLKLSPDGRKLMLHFTDEDGEKELGPWLAISDGSDYRTPKGARLITIFSSAIHLLTIAKIGSEYKIINAKISSPD